MMILFFEEKWEWYSFLAIWFHRNINMILTSFLRKILESILSFDILSLIEWIISYWRWSQIRIVHDVQKFYFRSWETHWFESTLIFLSIASFQLNPFSLLSEVPTKKHYMHIYPSNDPSHINSTAFFILAFENV